MRLFKFAPLILGAFLATTPLSSAQAQQARLFVSPQDVFTTSNKHWLLKTNLNQPNTVQVALDSTGLYPLTRQLCQYFANQLGYSAESFSSDSTKAHPKANATLFFNAALKSLREQNGSDTFLRGTQITLNFDASKKVSPIQVASAAGGWVRQRNG